MGLTSTQMSLCLNSYWYMWWVDRFVRDALFHPARFLRLTNGLSGLLFIGIDLGKRSFPAQAERRSVFFHPSKASRLSFWKNSHRMLTRRRLITSVRKVVSIVHWARHSWPLPTTSLKQTVWGNPVPVLLPPNQVRCRTFSMADSIISIASQTTRPPSVNTTISNSPRCKQSIVRVVCTTLDPWNWTHNWPPSPNDGRRRWPARANSSTVQWKCVTTNGRRSGKTSRPSSKRRSLVNSISCQGRSIAHLCLLDINIGEKMIRRWLKEGRKYNFGGEGHKTTENFTQMVWQASQEIGVGRARSEDGNWYYGVVVFNPPGNIPNKYVNNVLMPTQS